METQPRTQGGEGELGDRLSTTSKTSTSSLAAKTDQVRKSEEIDRDQVCDVYCRTCLAGIKAARRINYLGQLDG